MYFFSALVLTLVMKLILVSTIFILIFTYLC